ncbi:MAG: hypothetical protein ACOY3O_09470 [Thermodesulfobacteriota bacterium]
MAIELDGGGHGVPQQRESDDERPSPGLWQPSVEEMENLECRIMKAEGGAVDFKTGDFEEIMNYEL